MIYIMKLILKKLRKKEGRKTFSGKKKALFFLKNLRQMWLKWNKQIVLYAPN